MSIFARKLKFYGNFYLQATVAAAPKSRSREFFWWDRDRSRPSEKSKNRVSYYEVYIINLRLKYADILIYIVSAITLFLCSKCCGN